MSPEVDVTKITQSDIKSEFSAGTENYYDVSTEETDSADLMTDTRWENENWSQYLGYYKTIPELTAAIDAKATWTVGKGYTADEITTLILDRIKGWGKDTFNTILENLIRTCHIGGDAFAEIITNEKGFLINLKPLDPSRMVIVANNKGVIKRYEQLSKIKGGESQKFQPEEIFHLARNRVADEIHGVSLIKALEWIILARNRAMEDWDRVLHRNVDPMMVHHLDTDDQTQINSYKATVDAAKGRGENLYIPKGAVEIEYAQVAPNATLNPLPWIEALNQYFFQATGVPDIVVGGTGAITEASAKIAYLAFQQTIEEEQLFIEEQVLAQLNLVINLEFPASLENEALSDKPKGEPTIENRGMEQEQPNQPNDTTAETEGLT